MDEKARLRQFYLRFFLAVAMLWGALPFITVPFLGVSSSNGSLARIAAIFSCVTVLPACVLAFWRRGIACAWLTGNAVLLLAALAGSLRPAHRLPIGGVVEFGGAIAIAAWLDWVQMKGWPPALDRPNASV